MNKISKNINPTEKCQFGKLPNFSHILKILTFDHHFSKWRPTKLETPVFINSGFETNLKNIFDLEVVFFQKLNCVGARTAQSFKERYKILGLSCGVFSLNKLKPIKCITFYINKGAAFYIHVV